MPRGTDLLRLQSADPARYPAAAGKRGGRRRAVAAGTCCWCTRRRRACGCDADGLHATRWTAAPLGGDFLDALDARLAGAAGTPPRRRRRCRSAAAGRCSWPTNSPARSSPCLRLPPARGPLPVACALRCPAAVLRDRGSGACVAVAEAGAAALLDAIAPTSRRAASLAGAAAGAHRAAIEEDAPQRFLDGVARIHDYLRAGDVFQVNLSRAWRARFDARAGPGRPVRAPARSQSGAVRRPAAAGDGWALAQLVARAPGVGARRRASRRGPIAGTRPRFAGDDDAARIRELVGHPKERAEHVMLIDLERNDLGRVCVPGSVLVDELMTVESYAHVHHIVSNVARRAARRTPRPGDVIRAVFPGGTITGCPKVRCMQIIAELEGEGRGAYTGALGYLNRDGDLDLNILIRSAWLAGRELQFRTGAGIVVDSDAAARTRRDPRQGPRPAARAGRGRVSALAALGCSSGTQRVGRAGSAPTAAWPMAMACSRPCACIDGAAGVVAAHLARLCARVRRGCGIADARRRPGSTSQLAGCVAPRRRARAQADPHPRRRRARLCAARRRVEPTLAAVAARRRRRRRPRRCVLRWCETRLAHAAGAGRHQAPATGWSRCWRAPSGATRPSTRA